MFSSGLESNKKIKNFLFINILTMPKGIPICFPLYGVC